jgi:cob(I)alamin adenosyltransferase
MRICDSMSKETFGLVQVYTGGGKGKTTASLGLALRAVGQGFKVYMIQFMKSGDTGELFSIKKYVPHITIVQFGKDALIEKQLKMFEFDGKGDISPTGPEDGYYYFPPDSEEKEPARRGFEHASRIILSGKYDLVILDEINCVMDKGLLDTQKVIELLRNKPEHVEVILTGRGMPPEIKAIANLVTEMVPRKHYFHEGVLARRGIEF